MYHSGFQSMEYASDQNVDPDTGEILEVVHRTEYVQTTEDESGRCTRWVLTIIESAHEEIVPESEEVIQVLSECGFPVSGWKLG